MATHTHIIFKNNCVLLATPIKFYIYKKMYFIAICFAKVQNLIFTHDFLHPYDHLCYYNYICMITSNLNDQVTRLA